MSVVGRVLVVEDVRVQALHLRRTLEHSGHKVEVAADARAALAALDALAFDLVLTDLRLADEDGMALFRKAREAHGEETPTFVILTAFGTVEGAREALKSG